MTYYKDHYLALDRAGTLVAHGEDYDEVLVEATRHTGTVDAELPGAQVLIVKGSLVSKE